jgi:hypothetical protein
MVDEVHKPISGSAINTAVNEYKVAAGELERKRSELEKNLTSLMNQTVIPAARASLPRGYGINETKSKVLFTGRENTIPGAIEFELRLYYESGPVVAGIDSQLPQIQQRAHLDLKPLENQYGVRIHLMGEPVQIG